MYIARSIADRIKPHLDTPEVIVVTGMRRTGKTTLMRHLYESVSSDNKIFLDLENPLNRRLFEEENYERVRSSMEVLGLSFSPRAYVFLDEIQFVRQLPSVVKYLHDHYGAKFFLTGSASFYLKNLFTESLSGRKALFDLYPLTFREFLAFKGLQVRLPEDVRDVSRSVHDIIAPLYEEYVLFGGFPQVVLKKSFEEKRRALDDIFTSFFQLEVLQLRDFRRNNVIRDLMLLLLQRTGSKVDFSRLCKEMGISRPTLVEYVSFLEGAYFIKTVQPFSRGRDTEIRKTPKVYACDSGMANHFAKLDMGRLFENAILCQLSQKTAVRYYRRKTGVELDFICDGRIGYEVKASPVESDVRRAKALAQEIGLRECKVISMKQSDLEGVVPGFLI